MPQKYFAIVNHEGMIPPWGFQPGFAMRRKSLFALVIFSLGILNGRGPAVAATVPLPDEEENAIFVLLDPHAGSNSKISAVRVLMNQKYAPDSPQGERIVEVLVRQAHYDMAPVRDLCRTALISKIGAGEAAHRIATFNPARHIAAIGDYVMDFRRALRGWKDSDELAEALASENSTRRQEAMKQVVALAQAHPEHFPGFVDLLKSRLLDHLDRFDRAEPSMRPSTFVLVEQLASQAEDAVPILKRSLADQDPQVRKVLQHFYSAGAGDPRRAIELAIASGLVDADSKIAEAAAKWVPEGPDDSLKATIARAVATAAGNGNEKCLSLLKRYEIKPAVFARAVLWSTPDHSRWLGLLRALRLAGAQEQLDEIQELRRFVVNLLNAEDENLAQAAAELLLSPRARAEGEKRIVETINDGKTIRPAILKSLNPDPEEFSTRLLDALQNNNSTISRAAVRSLLVTGIKGEKIRPPLEALLRSPDPELRHAAAALLNTPKALAEAKLPDLLADIRSNSISARQLAARQLDELGIEPKEITAALIRAVESGNFAARRGLTAALQDAYASNRNPLDLLKQTASDQQTKTDARAFARAALHEVEHPAQQKEPRP